MPENLYNDDDRQYLQMMQENITRMATNSANAKTWMVTIVAAILAIGCSIKEIHYWLLLALIPTFVLWYLDAYYLQLECKLRNREQYYINLLTGKEQCENPQMSLYDFRPLHQKQNNEKLRYVETGSQLFNMSVCPLYSAMCLVIIAVTGVVNGWLNSFF